MKQLIIYVLGYALCLFPNLLPATAWAVQVKDYGVEVAPTPGSIHWMNESRLVFKGLVAIQETRPTQYPGKRVGKFATLDLKTGKIEWYGEFTGQLCVDGEQVAYANDNRDIRALSEKDRFWLVRGTLHSLSSREISREELQGFDFSLACRASSELSPLPAWTKGKLIKRLRPEHGLLEYQELQQNERVSAFYPAKLYRPGASQGPAIELPDVFKSRLQAGYRVNFTPRYFAYKKAYLINTEYWVSPLPDGISATLWWLYPDGRIEEALTYKRDRNWPLANEIGVMPTRNGILFMGADPSLTRFIGKSGVYRYQQGTSPKRVVAGRLGGGFALSPDGCKLAFGSDDRFRIEGNGQYKLRVINVCEGEQK